MTYFSDNHFTDHTVHFVLKFSKFLHHFYSLISICTSGKLSKYEVSSIDAILTEMAAGLSLMLPQSMLPSQGKSFMSSRLETLRSSDVNKLRVRAL